MNFLQFRVIIIQQYFTLINYILGIVQKFNDLSEIFINLHKLRSEKFKNSFTNIF